MDDELEYVVCPKCGNTTIEAMGEVCLQLFSDNGTLVIGETSKSVWSGESDASCPDCNWQGKVKDAVMTEAPAGCLAVNKGVNQNEPIQMSIGRGEQLP